MSDWGATHSTVKAANSGLDMQMPDATFFGAPLKEAILKGEVSVNRLNDMVLRILVPMFTMGLFDRPITGNLSVVNLLKIHFLSLVYRMLDHLNTLNWHENWLSLARFF